MEIPDGMTEEMDAMATVLDADTLEDVQMSESINVSKACILHIISDGHGRYLAYHIRWPLSVSCISYPMAIVGILHIISDGHCR